MTNDQKRECELIIHGAAVAAGAVGAGAAQLPGADAVLIMPIQVAMIIALGKKLGIKVSQSAARSAAYATLGTIVGKGASALLVRRIPGLGNVVNAGIAGGVTEVLGRTVMQQMAQGEFAG
ncbi:MAG: hypothetical protein ACR2QM_04755 [Longimicrobiales bacterium]